MTAISRTGKICEFVFELDHFGTHYELPMRHYGSQPGIDIGPEARQLGLQINKGNLGGGNLFAVLSQFSIILMQPIHIVHRFLYRSNRRPSGRRFC